MGGLFPGTMITPAVRLVRPLRSGGMGNVWVAEHLGLHTQVAVKFLSTDLAQDPESVVRFKNEAAAASAVKSPHVVQTFDHGVHSDGLPFIVMELLEGEDLTHRLKRGPLPPGEVAKIVAQVAKALGRAHEKGIIHRDIKPDNIFMVETGDDETFCKLLDFGVAKSASASGGTMSGHTATGSMVGTPYYMSPEQAVSARDIDYRSDLWSLGMVAFEAMTGRRALDADSLGALVLALHTAPLPAPSSFDPTLSPDIDRWFEIACAKLPRDRFQSAREMADALLMVAGEAPSPRRNEGSEGQRRLSIEGAHFASTPLSPRTSGYPTQVGPAQGSRPKSLADATLHGLDDPFESQQRPKVAEARRSLPTLDAEDKSGETKVPSLLPPPPSPRLPTKSRAGDDDWKQLIDRTHQVERSEPIAVPVRRSTTSSFVERERPRSKAPVVILLLGLGVVLLTGAALYQRRAEAMRVLFPSQFPEPAKAGGRP